MDCRRDGEVVSVCVVIESFVEIEAVAREAKAYIGNELCSTANLVGIN